jgi:hypothetical protein
MDIETIKYNNKLIPYAICAYNGYTKISTFNSNLDKLFYDFIKELLINFLSKSKVKSLTVYAHNFSSFDGIFLLKHLVKFGEVKPLLFNGKLISITVKILTDIEELKDFNGKTILFKDSYLLLPVSLRNLAKLFNTTENKGLFPFLLYDINYIGTFPKFEYFNNITFDQYLLESKVYEGKIWNFKDNSLKYCMLDCVLLHEIITKFNDLVFNEFQVNIHKILTLPGLSMKIFKTHYLPR